MIHRLAVTFLPEELGREPVQMRLRVGLPELDATISMAGVNCSQRMKTYTECVSLTLFSILLVVSGDINLVGEVKRVMIYME